MISKFPHNYVGRSHAGFEKKALPRKNYCVFFAIHTPRGLDGYFSVAILMEDTAYSGLLVYILATGFIEDKSILATHLDCRQKGIYSPDQFEWVSEQYNNLLKHVKAKKSPFWAAPCEHKEHKLANAP